jgi:putative acetyltransferase
VRRDASHREDEAMTSGPPGGTPAVPPGIRIEPERDGDQDAIRALLRRAFATDPGVAVLVDLIRASPNYLPELSLVARDDAGGVLGHVMLSWCHIVEQGASGQTRHRVLTLSPLAVTPTHERRGIGGALVAAGRRGADALGAPLVVLEGSPAYYPRFGFRDCRPFGITIDLPDWAPREAGMVHPLRAYDPAIRGKVEYPPAFAESGV